MRSLSDKDEIMNKLSNRLKYLACDVGERDGKLNNMKANYLHERMNYHNSQNRRGNRNGPPFIMPDRFYQLPSPRNAPFSFWQQTGAGYPRAARYPSYGVPRRQPGMMGADPMNMTQLVQPWNPSVPSKKPAMKRTIPHGEWAVCWNFNSARGCPRGKSCPWRHQKYSANANETKTREPQSAHKSSASFRPPSLEVAKAQSGSHKEEVPEIENKNEEDGTTEVVCETNTSILTNPIPLEWSANVKTRDIDTDSKEEKSQEEKSQEDDLTTLKLTAVELNGIIE